MNSFWDDRYKVEDYVYGREPNDFLRAEAHRIAPGRVLCLAEGEGRNAVFLAGLGHQVTAVDQSIEGLRKADRLAREHGVEITTVQADLATDRRGAPMSPRTDLANGLHPLRARAPLARGACGVHVSRRKTCRIALCVGARA